jgi:hypothetical protein
MDAAGDAVAGAALAARVGRKIGGAWLDAVGAVHRLRRGTGHGPLPNSRRAGEEQRRRQRLAVNRARDERCQTSMADDLAQGHRTNK